MPLLTAENAEHAEELRGTQGTPGTPRSLRVGGSGAEDTDFRDGAGRGGAATAGIALACECDAFGCGMRRGSAFQVVGRGALVGVAHQFLYFVQV